MIERDYYPAINKYYLANIQKYKKTIVWEAKLTKTNTLSLNCLADHQEDNLLKAERAMAHKIADLGRAKKPFDGIVVFEALSIVVAIFYKPRGTKVYEIYTRDFLSEKYTSGKKSITKERAEELCFNIMDI